MLKTRVPRSAQGMSSSDTDTAHSASTRALPGTLPSHTGGAVPDAGSRSANASTPAAPAAPAAQSGGLLQRLQRYNAQAAAAQTAPAPAPAQPDPDNSSDCNRDPESLMKPTVPRSTFLLLILLSAVAVHYVLFVAGAIAIPAMVCNATPLSKDPHAKPPTFAQAILQRCNIAIYPVHRDNAKNTYNADGLHLPWPAGLDNLDEPPTKFSSESDDEAPVIFVLPPYGSAYGEMFNLDKLESDELLNSQFIILSHTQQRELVSKLEDARNSYNAIRPALKSFKNLFPFLRDSLSKNLKKAFAEFFEMEPLSMFAFQNGYIFFVREADGIMFNFQDLLSALDSYSRGLNQILFYEQKSNRLKNEAQYKKPRKEYTDLHKQFISNDVYNKARDFQLKHAYVRDIFAQLSKKLNSLSNNNSNQEVEEANKDNADNDHIDVENHIAINDSQLKSDPSRYPVQFVKYLKSLDGDETDADDDCNCLERISYADKNTFVLNDKAKNELMTKYQEALSSLEVFKSVSYVDDNGDFNNFNTSKSLELLSTFNEQLNVRNVESITFDINGKLIIKLSTGAFEFDALSFHRYISTLSFLLRTEFLTKDKLYTKDDGVKTTSNHSEQLVENDKHSELFNKAKLFVQLCEKLNELYLSFEEDVLEMRNELHTCSTESTSDYDSDGESGSYDGDGNSNSDAESQDGSTSDTGDTLQRTSESGSEEASEHDEVELRVEPAGSAINESGLDEEDQLKEDDEQLDAKQDHYDKEGKHLDTGEEGSNEDDADSSDTASYSDSE